MKRRGAGRIFKLRLPLERPASGWCPNSILDFPLDRPARAASERRDLCMLLVLPPDRRARALSERHSAAR
ncbi:hypothetical protein Nepgr_018790 [Nepenthes gracilis]|uniref:Uncharacterized protein n=1 Tax=Nepenthes gracilis TaxID=150966 RepID=A0AAD3XUD1_NEPGR|nr:hypothetical protein Nepgr_018790 [Nepenthes gracilis]